MRIIVEDRIKQYSPGLQIGLIRANVVNSETSEQLWEELQTACQRISDSYELSWINKRPAIAATRELYKRCGKDPNRYRVSSEALCRRIVKGLGIYRINTLVDLINLVSIRSGYPISALDAAKLEGDSLSLGIGEEGEYYEGIGRGQLNIAGMPVYRDAKGGVATPTSDEERTKITELTTRVQININGYAEEMPMAECVDWVVTLLKKYAMATDIETQII